MKSISRSDVVWLALFLAALLGIGVLMFRVSASVVASAESQREWDDWRVSVKKGQAHVGPVARVVPKSDRPPALVLLKEYFAVTFTMVMVLSAVLLGTFILFARGVMNSQRTVPLPDEGRR